MDIEWYNSLPALAQFGVGFLMTLFLVTAIYGSIVVAWMAIDRSERRKGNGTKK